MKNKMKYSLIWVITVLEVLGLGQEQTNTSGLTDEKYPPAIGVAVKKDKYPFIVSIHLNYGDNSFVCGGTMVTPTQLLTCGKCLFYRWGGVMPPIITIVLSGRQNLNERPQFVHNVTDIAFHSEFDSRLVEYDLVLLKVSQSGKPVDATSKTTNQYLQKKTQNYDNCEVVGWYETTGDMRSTPVRINMKCVKTSQICTLDNVCNMSRGSALMCNGRFVGFLTSNACNGSNTFETIYASREWLYMHDVSAGESTNPNIIVMFFISALAIYITR